MKNSKWKTHKIKDCLQQTETTIVNLQTIKFWPMEPWVTWQFFKSWNLDEILWLCCFWLEMFHVFLACFCHILFSRINTEMKVIFQRCQVLGTLLTISALHTVGSTWPASPKKQVLSAAISTSISSVNPPSLLRSAQFNQTTNECGPVTSWFHLLWIASVLISIYVNFTLICCETKENWGCTCAFSQSGTKCSFRWNDDVNCVSSLSRSLKEDCVWFI